MMADEPIELILCAVCEKHRHMAAHILCRGCFLDAGGYFNQTIPTENS